MKQFCLLLSICFISFAGHACLNESVTRADGESTGSMYPFYKYYRAFDVDFSQKLVDYYDLSKKDSIPFEELSDVSVHLAKLGKYEESLSLLLWLYERYPEDYSINANLGTLYELNGNNDSAYYFIEKSMQIDPESHDGSEWVHLAILKAKMQMADNPDWIYTNGVVNFYYTTALDADSSLTWDIIDSLHDISYQMHERIPFSPVPDPLIANLFNELGDMMHVHYSIRDAYIAYLISGAYDPEDKFKTREKLSSLESAVSKEDGGLPVLDDYFSKSDEFDDVSDDLLPGYKPAPVSLDKIGGAPNFDDSSYKWMIWIGIASGGVLIGLLVFFLKRRS